MQQRLATVLIVATLATGLLVALASPASAGGWQTPFPNHPALPTALMAVDKSSQTFFLLKHHSPLQVERSLRCTTGQAMGDKRVRGDLKTPEGVYFVQSIIRGGLDFGLYGDIAYTLDYPNPIDRMKGKTGSGIWIHGRGHEVIDRETRGCVAIYNPEIQTLDGEITPGMPVVIASRIKDVPLASMDGGGAVLLANWQVPATDENQAFSATAEHLTTLTRRWADAWQNESDAFFAFYEPAKFDRAHAPSTFDHFRERKERIFASQPWLQVMVTDVHALPGPDYWVTSFRQFYRTPSLTSSIAKRLYWQQDDTGWHIVGRETDYLSDEATRQTSAAWLERATSEVMPVVEGWRNAWLEAEVDHYAAYFAPEAVQGHTAGRDAIEADKTTLWADEAKRPARITFETPSVQPHPQGVEVTFTQRYAAHGGYSDVGIKTLVLAPAPRPAAPTYPDSAMTAPNTPENSSADSTENGPGNEPGWQIILEEWRAL